MARTDTVDTLVRAVFDRAAARRRRESAQHSPTRKRPIKEPDRKKRKPIREPGKPPKPVREPKGRDDEQSDQDARSLSHGTRKPLRINRYPPRRAAAARERRSGAFATGLQKLPQRRARAA